MTWFNTAPRQEKLPDQGRIRLWVRISSALAPRCRSPGYPPSLSVQGKTEQTGECVSMLGLANTGTLPHGTIIPSPVKKIRPQTDPSLEVWWSMWGLQATNTGNLWPAQENSPVLAWSLEQLFCTRKVRVKKQIRGFVHTNTKPRNCLKKPFSYEMQQKVHDFLSSSGVYFLISLLVVTPVQH